MTTTIAQQVKSLVYDHTYPRVMQDDYNKPYYLEAVDTCNLLGTFRPRVHLDRIQITYSDGSKCTYYRQYGDNITFVLEAS